MFAAADEDGEGALEKDEVVELILRLIQKGARVDAVAHVTHPSNVAKYLRDEAHKKHA